MGVLIYKSGELNINGYKDEESLEEFLAEAELVKDGWGGIAFFVTSTAIEFAYDTQEGCTDPYGDAVEKPLTDILKLAKKYGVQLDGSFTIGSSCSDYDNITILESRGYKTSKIA